VAYPLLQNVIKELTYSVSGVTSISPRKVVTRIMDGILYKGVVHVRFF